MNPPRLTPAEVNAALRTGRHVTPSKPDPWIGTPVAGSKWTREQHTAIARAGRNPDQVEGATMPLYEGEGLDRRLVKHAICPVLQRRRGSARMEIATPAGDTVWVKA